MKPQTSLASAMLALSLVLGGCTTTTALAPQPTGRAPVPATLSATEYVCASATAALKTAIVFNAKLSPTTRARVTQAAMVLNPVCSQEKLPTLSSTAFAALQGALSQLTAAAAEATR